MKHVFIFLIFLLSTAPSLAEPPKTVIEDQAEADLLLGRHLFTAPALATANLVSTFVNFGEAKIYKKSENFHIEADHTCYQRIPRYPKEIKGGYVRITGKILKIKKDEFTLKGTLSGYLLPPFNAGNTEAFDCTVEDIFTFSRKAHPKYWRLQLTQSAFYYERPENQYKICLAKFYDTPIIFSAQLEDDPPHNCARILEDAQNLPLP